MTKDVGWYHPTDTSDQWDGFNESGIEHFAGNPMTHLAREIVQNAFDAGKEDETVVVRFELKTIDTNLIPDKEELEATIRACVEAARNESEKAEAFFLKADKILRGKRIPVLEITDSNTSGMQGPCTNGTPYYAFMKAKGQSKKSDSNASGSFGIGKFAPYVVSGLRTLLVSTCYKREDGAFEHLAQGKSILMSHDLAGKRKQGIGFWGVKDKCQPIVDEVDSLQPWLTYPSAIDDEDGGTGSRLHVLGFEEHDKWQVHLAVSIAENFFGAIGEARLNVFIDDELELTDSTIEDFFEDQRISEIIEEEEFKNEPEQFDNCSNYLVAFHESSEVHIEESQTVHLGRCRLRIFVKEGLPKKVCVLRNGMFITDNLQGLKQFSGFKDFVAVFSCEDTEGNKLLRNMEPPRHDDFEPERLGSDRDQKKGRAALRQISSWVREMLARHAKDPVSEVTEIEEMRDFFGEEGEAEDGNSLEEINPFGKVVIRGKPLKQRFGHSSALGDSDEQSGEEDGDGGGGGASGEGGGDGKRGAGNGEDGRSSGGRSTPKPVLELEHTRAILITNRKRKLYFTPRESGKAKLVIREAGADTDYDFPVVSSNRGTIEDGSLILSVKKNIRTSVELNFSEDFDKALKVVAYAV